MEWTEEQEASAKKKVLENSQPLPTEKQGCVDVICQDSCLCVRVDMSRTACNQDSIPACCIYAFFTT